MEEKGIKEITELLDGLGELASFAGAATKDGRIGIDDLSYLIALGSKFDVLANAASGIDEALLEAKNLKQDEVLVIIGKVYEIVKRFELAKK